jgi:hypothetical protein
LNPLPSLDRDRGKPMGDSLRRWRSHRLEIAGSVTVWAKVQQPTPNQAKIFLRDVSRDERGGPVGESREPDQLTHVIEAAGHQVIATGLGLPVMVALTAPIDQIYKPAHNVNLSGEQKRGKRGKQAGNHGKSKGGEGIIG